ncbi:MAG: glutaredoxin 3 [Desulfobacterales bacterium]|nr:glutaredoxin 3 [Desulfobacterales bacterium]
MKNIVIYTSRTCPYCEKAKILLKKKGASFEEIRVDEKPEKVREAVERSGGLKTVPQIFIGDHHIGGCDDLYALEKEGKLDSLLAV